MAIISFTIKGRIVYEGRLLTGEVMADLFSPGKKAVAGTEVDYQGCFTLRAAVEPGQYKLVLFGLRFPTIVRFIEVEEGMEEVLELTFDISAPKIEEARTASAEEDDELSFG